MQTTTLTFEEHINSVRAGIKKIAAVVNDSKKNQADAPLCKGEDRGEVMANLTLCYRHLEDASMRLGKVLQHRNGGVSIYDKNVVGSPEEEDTNHKK